MNFDNIHIENFSIIGVNHWDAPLNVREKFSLSEQLVNKIYKMSIQQDLNDYFIVSTCNRTEIYTYSEIINRIKYCFLTYSEGTPEEFDKYIFEKKGEDAVRHLMRVSTGLDSQILGDMQILNQVKTSYETADSYGLISGKFHRLMQHVFRAHKKSRNSTDLGEGAATVAHAAVRQAMDRYHDLKLKNILLVGSGEMGKTTCKNLYSLGCRDITVCNRTEERAESLSDKYHLETLDYKNLTQSINQFDIVIVSTSAQDTILNVEDVNESFARSGEKLFIDLSVPHNIDLKFGELENVELLNMDKLSNVTDEAYERRKESIPRVEKIIESEIFEYKKWLEEQKIVPAIKALNKKFNEIRTEEFEFFKYKIQDQDKEKIEKLTKRIVSRIASYSIQHLRDNLSNHDDSVEIIKEMYKLKLDE